MGRRIEIACIGVLGGMACLFGADGPAQADFTVCNRTSSVVELAVAYQQRDIWISEGWWSAEPGGCTVVIVGDLDAQVYYVRGQSDSNTWQEDYSFCYSNDVFTIQGDENCTARGYKSGGFMEVDVGNALDFTLELTE